MANSSQSLITRPVAEGDLEDLCALLNEIIITGGTTAIEEPLSFEEFRDYFMEGERHICCTVAANPSGRVLGFQALGHYPGLPEDWADIATFTQRSPRIPGVGSCLFPISLSHAQKRGCKAINATIRADNTGGLAYYSKMGFEDYARDKNVPLKKGQLVDRISKRFLIS